VWDDDYRSRIDDTNLFRVQSDIAASVSDSLKIVIGDEERLSLGEMPTKNLVAYELYIQGKYQFDLVTSESLYQSITLFSKAIELDSTFEAAYVAKADAYRMLMAYFEKPVDVLPNIIDAVVESLAISPDSAEARSSLGLAYVFAWRWNDAWNMLNEARNRNPNLALTELGFALYYSGLGDIEGVHRSLDRAAILDPLNVEIADWGHWALAMVGETKEAIAWAKIQMEIHPQVGVIFSGASVSASMNSEHKRAIFLATRGLELDPENPFAQLVLAQAYAYASEYNKALPLLNKAEKSPSYVCPYESAIVYLQLRNLDKTFDLLNDAVDFRSNCLVFVHNDSRLSSLRNDPRFISILTRVGLDEVSYHSYPR
jgi:tetratricopeptide (TPR) repeat protein